MITIEKTITDTLPKRYWRFPESAKFGRVIPKEKIYQQASVNGALKQLFVEQVGQIKWAYKLAENTINLTQTQQVDEIEIIHIKLKTQTLDNTVLATIDKAIPHPTLFICQREIRNPNTDDNETRRKDTSEIAYMACHKQKSSLAKTTGKEKWQHSQYLQSAWIAINTDTRHRNTSTHSLSDRKKDAIQAQPLPTATNLERLYEQLLQALIPYSPSDNKVSETRQYYQAKGTNEIKGIAETITKSKPAIPIEQQLALLDQIKKLKKQLSAVKTKRDKEKQFNRRCELNDNYKAIKQQLTQLQDETSA